MKDCPRCIQLTRELREAREEIQAWEDMRTTKKPRGDRFAALQQSVMATDETTADAALIKLAYPKMSPAHSRAVSILAKNAGQVVTKRALFEVISTSPETDNKVVDQVIFRARRVIGKDTIRTVSGIGYLMPEKSAALIRRAMEEAGI